MYLDNGELYNILHMLNSTHNQGIANAIDKEKFKHRMHDQERLQTSLCLVFLLMQM